MEEEFLSKYRECAVEHGEQSIAGNSVAANKAHDQLLAILKSLCEINADGAIMSLLNDETPSVRLWAAAHSLEINEEKALTTLNKLSSAGVPIISMSARYTVQGWQNGELRVRQSL